MHSESKTPTENPSAAPAAKKRKWLWRLIPVSFLLLLALAIVLMGGKIKSEAEALQEEKAAAMQQKQPDINVVSLALAPSAIKDRISLPASVMPWVNLTVLTEVRGKVTTLKVREGQRVSRGDIIAHIDHRDYENTLRSTRASLSAAKANLKRLSELQRERLSTRSQLDDAVAQVESLQAAMDTAALNLERCAITAPMDGIINKRHIEKGQYLNVADPVAEILQIDRVKIIVGIPESDVEAVRRLDRFSVTIDALGGQTFTAKKYFLSHTADSQARVFPLELALDNRNHEILPDMFARVEIIKNEIPDGLAVPLYAIISRNDQHLVYVVEDNLAKARRIDLGIQEGWRIQAKSGLQAGDQVIVVGQRSVNDGTAVKVVRAISDIKELNE
ncbi:MAG: efflux RND transporter periplasmic adaptor subunit [Desulfosarcinaceae bacterium]|nr:efflux RND transporter periplasmic adaptor subunit [Desulfosarcinaceae bacterium]